jgi:hypothetical protein
MAGGKVIAGSRQDYSPDSIVGGSRFERLVELP